MLEAIPPIVSRPRSRLSRPVTPRRLHEMYLPKHLAGVIRRERARADRQQGKFCLVMLRLAPARGRLATLRLSRLAMRMIRSTDEVGLYDRHTVCAVLPDTSPDGAHVFICRMFEACQARGMNLEPVLYSYPSDRLDDYAVSAPRAQSCDNQAIAGRMRMMIGDAPTRSAVDALPMETLLTRKAGRMKRALDVAVAGTAVTIASPLLLAIAAGIRLSDKGPAMFCQYRTGLGGRPFKIYKFRTMRVNADGMKSALRAQSEQDGPAFKMTRDPRVTRLGRLLRKTSLDELPQLFNVLKGDMSLVGPRPLPIDEQAACDPWHRARLDVMPGLTCVWQVKGRSRVSFDEWMRMDLAYAKRDQVLDDLKLIALTIPAVLLRRGAK